MPEAQWIHAIESVSGVTLLVENLVTCISSPDGTICISSKFDHKMVPLALVRDLTIEFVTNLANRISYKFDVEDNNALVETYHVYH